MLESMKSKNKIKGNYGERVVYEYLEKCGYEIVMKNFKCNLGEIDIIFMDKNELVFAEIKSRTSAKYGFPAESVTDYKKKHILNTAKYFLYKTEMFNAFVRFDVIEVYLKEKNYINHIKNVFW